MNDALWSWFWALSAPLKPHVQPVERVVGAVDVEQVAGVGVGAGVVDEVAGAEPVLDDVADDVARPVERTAPRLDRRGRLHWAFANGS